MALLSVMIVMSFSQVVLRQVFHTGILWGDTFLRQLVLWVGFLGAGMATADGKHFAWEPAAERKGGSGGYCRLLAHAATAVIAGLLARAAWSFAAEEKAAGQTLFTAGGVAVPSWLFAAAIPAGFLLVLAHTLIKTAEAAGSLKR